MDGLGLCRVKLSWTVDRSRTSSLASEWRQVKECNDDESDFRRLVWFLCVVKNKMEPANPNAHTRSKANCRIGDIV